MSRVLTAGVALINSGLRWWWTELTALAEAITRKWGHRAESAFLTCGPEGALIIPEWPRQPSGSGDAVGTEADTDMHPIDWRVHCAGRQVDVSLHPSQVLCLQLSLPRAALRSARSALAYKLIMESPIPPDQIYFAHRIPSDGPRRLGKDPDVVVDVAICRRQAAASVIDVLEASDVSAGTIGFSSAGRPPLDFVFLTSRAEREARTRRRIDLSLAACALLLCLATIPAILVAAMLLTAPIKEEIASAREAQGELMTLYEQQALVRTVGQELAAQTARPHLVAVLNDLADRLPASAWLQMIRYENGMLRMTGYASNPTEATAALQNSAMLSGVKLDSVTRAAGGNDSDAVLFEFSAAVAGSVSQ